MRLTEIPQRIATQAELLQNGGLRIRIQRELKNANSGSRHPHWGVTNRERRLWRVLIINALIDGLGYPQTLHLVGPGSNLPGAIGGLQCRCVVKPGRKTKRCTCPETLKRRLLIMRWIPTTRHLIRDSDNLIWSCKRLKDSVTSLGLLRDDAVRWCDFVVDQAVSADGLFWTEILISSLTHEQDIAC